MARVQRRDRAVVRCARCHARGARFPREALGIVRSPSAETAHIPTGPGARLDAEGICDLLPEFGEGLTEIEGFSPLRVR
jgi:tRNA (Thr-GGU) A37 N-methylase